MIAVASSRTLDQVSSHGADKVIDYTAADVSAAVGAPFVILLNLAPINSDSFAGLATLVRDGGVVVNTHRVDARAADSP